MIFTRGVSEASFPHRPTRHLQTQFPAWLLLSCCHWCFSKAERAKGFALSWCWSVFGLYPLSLQAGSARFHARNLDFSQHLTESQTSTLSTQNPSPNLIFSGKTTHPSNSTVKQFTTQNPSPQSQLHSKYFFLHHHFQWHLHPSRVRDLDSHFWTCRLLSWTFNFHLWFSLLVFRSWVWGCRVWCLWVFLRGRCLGFWWGCRMRSWCCWRGSGWVVWWWRGRWIFVLRRWRCWNLRSRNCWKRSHLLIFRVVGRGELGCISPYFPSITQDFE